MSIVAIGCNHRSTPLSILERMTIAPDDIPKALADLGSADHLSEVVVLSTCNRVEIYAYAEKFHGGYQDIREFFGRHAGLAPEDVNDHLYALHDTEAIRHVLFQNLEGVAGLFEGLFYSGILFLQCPSWEVPIV